MVLRKWLTDVRIRMFADVRWVGFLPPGKVRENKYIQKDPRLDPQPRQKKEACSNGVYYRYKLGLFNIENIFCVSKCTSLEG